MPDEFDPDWINSTIKECEKDGIEAVIISHEVVSTLNGDQMSRLKAAIGDLPTRLVLVVRHWPRFLPSRWMQNSMRRDSQPLATFLERMLAAADQRHDVRYDLILLHAAIAGIQDIAIVSYDNALKTKGVVATCATACGIILDWNNARDYEGTWANRSVPVAFVDKLRLFNGIYAEAEGLPSDALFDGAAQYGPVDRFFDYQRLVEGILSAHPELEAELDRHLAARSSRVELLPCQFERYSRIVGDAAAPFLVNPIQGKLFDEPEARYLDVSELTVAELPDPLRREMLKHLLRETPRTAHSGVQTQNV
jgi:hypothetical protein